MASIEEKITEVFRKYDKYPSHDGVMKNLDCWMENKKDLVDLLSKHPNWNQEELAIIWEVSERREIDPREVRQYQDEIVKLFVGSDADATAFLHGINEVCYAMQQYLPDSDTVKQIREYVGVKCDVGQKSSRVINKICRQYGVDKHPQFNASFAKLADALNPLEIKKKAVLSVHPCDYLEMSNKDNSWNSCHCLEDGCYQAGTLSYMNDSVSMIFYTVDEGVDSEYYKAKKRTREVFCYGNGILLQSRLYPKTHDKDINMGYRNLVQRIIASCLELPNLWTLKREQEEVMKHCKTFSGSLHYEDYIYTEYKANVSLLKEIADEDREKIIIGHTAYCIDCGSILEEENNVLCEGCDGEGFTCYECNEYFEDADDAYTIDGETYCRECVSICDDCDNAVLEELTKAIDANGNEIYVCGRCLDDYYYYCDGCDRYIHCDYSEEVIGGVRYCKDCIEDDFCECEECGEYVKRDETEEISGGYYCQTCVDDQFVRCDKCDNYFKLEDGTEIDGCYYCENCTPEAKEEVQAEVSIAG